MQIHSDSTVDGAYAITLWRYSGHFMIGISNGYSIQKDVSLLLDDADNYDDAWHSYLDAVAWMKSSEFSILIEELDRIDSNNWDALVTAFHDSAISGYRQEQEATEKAAEAQLEALPFFGMF